MPWPSTAPAACIPPATPPRRTFRPCSPCHLVRQAAGSFVTRFSQAGAVQFSTRIGGVDDEGARGLSIAGNVVTVTGTAYGAAFPLVNAPGTTCQPSDAFAASFNVASSTVLFSSCFGGSLDDEARGHVTDVVGTTYLFGFTDSKDLPVTNGVQSQADHSRQTACSSACASAMRTATASWTAVTTAPISRMRIRPTRIRTASATSAIPIRAIRGRPTPRPWRGSPRTLRSSASQ